MKQNWFSYFQNVFWGTMNEKFLALKVSKTNHLKKHRQKISQSKVDYLVTHSRNETPIIPIYYSRHFIKYSNQFLFLRLCVDTHKFFLLLIFSWGIEHIYFEFHLLFYDFINKKSQFSDYHYITWCNAQHKA